MQTLESQYGRESLTVAPEVPTIALRYRIGREHVSTPDADIELLVRQAIRKAPQPFTDSQRDETVRAALWIHHENRAEYVAVVNGRI